MTLRSHIGAALLALFAALPAAAQSPSFNCAKASSPREKAICSSPKLSALDAQVAAAYHAQLAHLSPAAADLIRSDQREWLHFLDLACPASSASSIASCLQSEDSNRLSQLRPIPQLTPGSPLFYNRSHFVVVPSKEKPDPNTNDPGFGTGVFSWPQIDNPTPQQTAWNQAIRAAAIRTTEDKDTNQSPTTFDSGVDPSGTVSLTVSLIAANDRLIVADITNTTYGYGAAHPNTSDTYLSWWLQPGRELTVNDVFAEQPNRNDSWKTRLIPLLYAKIKPDPVDDGPNWTTQKIKDSIAEELSKPTAWSITHDGFTLHFGQYEIGPYAIGMPTATLAWRDIESFLTPSLHPETLPRPLPGPAH